MKISQKLLTPLLALVVSAFVSSPSVLFAAKAKNEAPLKYSLPMLMSGMVLAVS